MRLLGADVGGTKTLLQLFDLDKSKRKVLRESRLECASFGSFLELVRAFVLPADGSIDAACFAIAGPTDDRRAIVTNIGWTVSAEEVEREVGIGRVKLVNDFHAAAAGTEHVRPRDIVSINPRTRDKSGVIAVLGAGTGLGEAILLPSASGCRHVIASEGGHASFAARSALQWELLQFLGARYEHVSWERVLSGSGIDNIFTFLCERVYHVSPEEVGVDAGQGHVAAQIARLASAGSEIARKTVEILIEIYGSEAGNLALKTLPRGGLFIAGGIAARNADWFKDGRFLEAYSSKGRMRGLLLEMPVEVVVNPNLGLIGACAIAIEAARG